MPINIPVVSALPDIVDIYNIAPWIWDGLIICLVLGLLLREGFKKAKIADDMQAGKLGGVVGFAIGLMLLLGMYRKGWQLIDIWPVLLIVLALFLAVLLWKFLVETFGEAHKTTITIIVIAIAVIVIALLIGSIPEYITGMLGGFGFYLLILAFWGAILFVLIFLVFRGWGAPPGSTPGGGGGGGILDKIGNAFKYGIEKIAAPIASTGWNDVIKPGARSSWDYIIKPGGQLIGWGAKGIWQAVTKKLGEAWHAIKETLGKIAQKRKDLKDASKSLRAAIKAARAAAEELKKKKDALMAELQNITSKIDALDSITDTAQIKKYSQLAAAYIPLIKTAYSNFMNQKIVDDFNRCQTQYVELKSLVEKLVADIRNLMEGIRTMRTEILKITDASVKSQLNSECERCWNAASALDLEIRASHDSFTKDIQEAIKDANLTKIEEVLVHISDEKTNLDTLLPIIIRLLNDLSGKAAPEAARIKNDIKLNCETAINTCMRLNERIKTLTDGYLKYMSTAVDAFETALEKDLAIDAKSNQFIALEKAITDLNTKMGAQLAKEDAAEEAKKRGIVDVTAVLQAVDAEKNTLLTLLKHMITLANNTENEITKCAGKFSTDPVNAENLLTTGLTEAKKACAAETRELELAATKTNDAIRKIEQAAKDLELLLKAEEGFAPAQKNMIQSILNNLNKFLSTNEEIKKLLKLFEYDLFMISTLQERIKANKSLTVKAYFAQIYTEISRLQKLIDELGVDEAILRKFEDEEFPPITPY